MNEENFEDAKLNFLTVNNFIQYSYFIYILNLGLSKRKSCNRGGFQIIIYEKNAPNK